MYISPIDGSVQLLDTLRLYPGMPREEVEALRDAHVLPQLHHPIQHHCLMYAKASPLQTIVYLENEKVDKIILSVPYRNSFPLPREEQITYLGDCLGEEFLNAFEAQSPVGAFPWGNAEFAWFDRENTLNLILTYHQAR